MALDESLWYAYGPQGETRQLTNSTGAVVDTYLYDPYGNLVSETGSDPNPFRFGGSAGYYSDPDMEDYVLCGDRWYSPDTGRWLSRDPIGYAGGDNLYEYCGDNPIGGADPSGCDDPDPTEGSENFDPSEGEFIEGLYGIGEAIGDGIKDLERDFEKERARDPAPKPLSPGAAALIFGPYPPDKGFLYPPVNSFLEPGCVYWRWSTDYGTFLTKPGFYPSQCSLRPDLMSHCGSSYQVSAYHVNRALRGPGSVASVERRSTR